MKKAGGRVSTTLPTQHAVGHCQAPPPLARWLAGRVAGLAGLPESQTLEESALVRDGYDGLWRDLHQRHLKHKNDSSLQKTNQLFLNWVVRLIYKLNKTINKTGILENRAGEMRVNQCQWGTGQLSPPQPWGPGSRCHKSWSREVVL